MANFTGRNCDNYFLSQLDKFRDHNLKLPGLIKTAITLLSTLLAAVSKDHLLLLGKFTC